MLIPVEERGKGKLRRRYVMVNGMRRKTFSGSGRARPPTREGVQRYANGRIVNAERGETETQIMKTVLDYRKRAGVKEDKLRDEKAGSALGRLVLTGALTMHQFNAGLWYAEICGKFAVSVGLAKQTPASASAVLLEAGGGSPAPEEDVQKSRSTRERYDYVFGALRDHEIMGRAPGSLRILNAICIRDQEVAMAEHGTLREALNVLDRLRSINA